MDRSCLSSCNKKKTQHGQIDNDINRIVENSASFAIGSCCPKNWPVFRIWCSRVDSINGNICINRALVGLHMVRSSIKFRPYLWSFTNLSRIDSIFLISFTIIQLHWYMWTVHLFYEIYILAMLSRIDRIYRKRTNEIHGRGVFFLSRVWLQHWL